MILKSTYAPSRATDPVALHDQHAFGPAALQLGHVVQQPVGVVGDLEVPLGQLALGDHRAAPLAHSGHDLLVGQHGLVLRAPVHVAGLAVGQAALEEPQEQPLGPAVVLRIGGVQPPRPVQAQSVALERVGLGLDVRVRPLGRMGIALDRRVLRRQTEGVPADRVQDVVALQPPVAGDHIAHHERFGVAHVQVARRVREHVQHVAALAAAVVGRDEGLVGLPEGLPPLLGACGVVAGALDLLGHLVLLLDRRSPGPCRA